MSSDVGILNAGAAAKDGGDNANNNDEGPNITTIHLDSMSTVRFMMLAIVAIALRMVRLMVHQILYHLYLPLWACTYRALVIFLFRLMTKIINMLPMF